MALQFRTAKRWFTKRVTPDYTNQLDLFSEVPEETPAPAGPSLNSAPAIARPRQQQLDFGDSEPLRLGDVLLTPPPMPAASNAARDAGTRPASFLPSETGAQDGDPPEVEDDDGRQPAAGKALDIEPE